jgi:hypothetical protein
VSFIEQRFDRLRAWAKYSQALSGQAGATRAWLAGVLAAAALAAGCGSAPPAGVRTAGEMRQWDDYRVQAARRIVAANPQLVYGGAVVEPLLAIPVLEVELHADGSIRSVDVLRQPSQARETTQIAIDAVRRAAPFGSVAHLPRPWKFAEAFLFNDEKRFKPRSLDVR